MSDPLTIQIPTQGWRQFLTARKDMLAAFDSAREKARTQKVESLHGRVAEAQLRDWLGNFLPRRYGVTAGYVISTGMKASQKAPHYDVIIYDQIESPVLWVETSPDTSSQGASRAIPVEHVRCVLEVKSSFNTASAGEAIAHLRDLLPLMGAVDASAERYKLHLPADFRCGTVFFELREADAHSQAALKKLIAGVELRGFFGGVVLRGEGHKEALTGKIELLSSNTPIEATAGTRRGLLHMGLTESISVTDDLHLGAMLTWSEPGFAGFAFDLLAMMQGTYEPGRVSSFYGLGSSQWDYLDKRDAQTGRDNVD